MQWASEKYFRSALYAGAYFRTRVLFSKRDRPDVVMESSGRTRGNGRRRRIPKLIRRALHGNEYFSSHLRAANIKRAI